MAWSDIIGQERVRDLLQRLIVHGRIPQSLILSGAEGVGTTALALAFARVLNCEQPVRTSTGVDACGECRSCHQARTLQHPNIRITMALPAGSGDSEEDLKQETVTMIRETIAAAAEDPYMPLRLEGASQIKIGQIRELKRTLTLSAVQTGHRVCIIADADLMTVEASNAFLKTLEEPHEQVTIILTTSHIERMLPTILSRCQVIDVPPLADTDIVTALARRGLDASQATLISSFAQGSITRAMEFMDEDLTAQRASVVDLLRRAVKGRDWRVALADAVQEFSAAADKHRAQAVCTLMQLWLRDAAAIEACGSSATVYNVDQLDALRKFSSAYGAADLSAATRRIDEAVRHLDRNVNPALVLLTMMLDIRSILAQARRATATA